MPASPEVWRQLWRDLKVIVEPLVADGWEIFDDDEDEDWPAGASVVYDLRRADEEIELELTEDQFLVVWRPGPSADIDGADPPLFVIAKGTPERCGKAFTERGWLSAPPPA
jgi:hypothetical protein